MEQLTLYFSIFTLFLLLVSFNFKLSAWCIPKLDSTSSNCEKSSVYQFFVKNANSIHFFIVFPRLLCYPIVLAFTKLKTRNSAWYTPDLNLATSNYEKWNGFELFLKMLLASFICTFFRFFPRLEWLYMISYNTNEVSISNSFWDIEKNCKSDIWPLRSAWSVKVFFK